MMLCSPPFSNEATLTVPEERLDLVHDGYE